MGNTGISRGTGNKEKSPSHLHISFPTKKLPRTFPHQGQATSYSYVSPRRLPTTEKPGEKKEKKKKMKIDKLTK